MNVGRIKIDGAETTISLGIEDGRIERNEVNEDTQRLDEVIDALKKSLDEEHK